MLIFTVRSYCLLKSFFLTVIRGERKEKVMFMHGNIKKFTIYETHNKAANTVTAIGQYVFSYTVLLQQWQVNTAVISVPVGGYNQQENLLSQLYSPELCHVNINFNGGGGEARYFTLSPLLFWRREQKTLWKCWMVYALQPKNKEVKCIYGRKELKTSLDECTLVFHKPHHKTSGMPQHMPKLRN